MGNSLGQSVVKTEDKAVQTENRESDSSSDHESTGDSLDKLAAQPSTPKFDPNITDSTVLGMIFDNGVLIATDTLLYTAPRSYMNESTRIFTLCDNIICGATGKLREIELMALYAQCSLEMHHYISRNRPALIETVANMLRTMILQADIYLASFLVAGLDENGLRLCSLHMCGTGEVLMYGTVGNDCESLMALLEDGWREDLSEEEAVDLAIKSFRYGLQPAENSQFRINMSIVRADGSVGCESRIIKVEADTSPISGEFVEGDKVKKQDESRTRQVAKKRESKVDQPPLKRLRKC